MIPYLPRILWNRNSVGYAMETGFCEIYCLRLWQWHPLFSPCVECKRPSMKLCRQFVSMKCSSVHILLINNKIKVWLWLKIEISRLWIVNSYAIHWRLMWKNTYTLIDYFLILENDNTTYLTYFQAKF